MVIDFPKELPGFHGAELLSLIYVFILDYGIETQYPIHKYLAFIFTGLI